MISFRALLALCALFLGACAQLPSGTLESPVATRVSEGFTLDGRFSLRQDQRSTSGRLSWTHTPASEVILLASPFGQGVAEIKVTPASATLTSSDGATYEEVDAETLTGRVLGYGLPVSSLVDWVRARPGDAEVMLRDSGGRPLRLKQGFWIVEYEYEVDDAVLPARIVVQHAGEFELRLRIDEWADLADAGEKP
jgi:outer membrane lipoprotein LolB